MKPKLLKPKAYNLKPNNAGFTLVEILAAFVIFSIILTVFSAVFLSSSNAEKRALNIQQAQENASYVLEAMAKEIRVSKISGPDTNCPSSPAASLNILNQYGENVIYSLSGGAVHRAVKVHRAVNGTDSVISSNTVDFTRLQFCILGTPIGDKKQPRVTIITSVKSKKTQQQASIDIQTTVSQRFLSDQY